MALNADWLIDTCSSRLLGCQTFTPKVTFCRIYVYAWIGIGNVDLRVILCPSPPFAPLVRTLSPPPRRRERDCMQLSSVSARLPHPVLRLPFWCMLREAGLQASGRAVEEHGNRDGAVGHGCWCRALRAALRDAYGGIWKQGRRRGSRMGPGNEGAQPGRVISPRT